MQQSKCPSCGATVFDQANAGSDIREMVINCQYCGSQFTVSNPNYRDPQPQNVSFSYKTTNFTYTDNSGTSRGNGWKEAGKGQHKFTSIAGQILAYIVAVPAVVCLLTGLIMWEPGAIIGGLMLGGFFLFFFLLSKASKRELKRRAEMGETH
ncbi:hypothetical protein [Chitinophaga sp. sic0106]|uniref:hypothetical protein n=1 Tax=Chitinophaga sp. sic0106 TaxID=2854785 RepID=UPI001C4472D5|nr:hypothetical protein [Chitinophaga sp. sic0106]MBV7532884.1 hypothetical protein [Chitinophaga sp. sic0106]